MKKWLMISSLLLSLIYWAFTIPVHPNPVPAEWPQPNISIYSLDAKKIKIGRILFYDPNLSADHLISCASCHSPYNAFAHTDHALSHGIGDSIGSRNAPALFNLAWQSFFMWDGAIADLKQQPIIPITHPKEMGADVKRILTDLNNDRRYKFLFRDAFGDSVVTKDEMLESMHQFMLSLISSTSRYDSMKARLVQFTVQEKNGYLVFQKACNKCHQEPLFTNGSFRNNGLSPNPLLNDHGRMAITKSMKDDNKFKVPSLRNWKYTFPYMHDGRFETMNEVLKHYDTVVHDNNQSSLLSDFKSSPMLNARQKTDLMAFLSTLNDRHFVFDSTHLYLSP